MRITQNMILRNTLRSINDNRDGMNLSQNRIATQKKVQKPSDDPIAFSRSVRFRRSLEQNKQFMRNVQDARSWVDTTSIGLNQLHDYTAQAYELAMQGADASSDANMRATMADSARGILHDMVNIGNTQYLGKSIFAGTATDESEPFDLQNDTVTYNGNDQYIKRRINENLTFEINTSGQELVDTGMFTAMTDLITALDNNDVDAIGMSIEALKSAKSNVLTLSTNMGTKAASFNLVYDRLESTNISLESFISDEEDTNMEEEIVKLKSQETAYQAALQSASSIMNLNIMNYMG